ncbi:recQ-mediated genome instability protein 1-like [Diorhabda carinulata]|uniref:recQ-mediated genome instability protein 1-like n=1 Tax=Diorhabda carinulata TaxID=1163345 RepID=UPI0025A02DF1|nr:recQ-mediated genome instability protein 1-like [Diorhabda carinulata]
MDEVTNLEIFFKSHQVHLSRIWLESCINWCKEENLPPNYSINQLQVNVFEQWLLLDLRDLEVPCLPPNLSSKEKFLLPENYTLQLMQIVDISKPKFWQLQRIRSSIPKNHEQEFENTKRVLQLTLTDGVQDVEAMEYKPIKCLNINLSPGIKIRLMGPIQIRRGRLLLEEQQVKVLGGEVDSLLISNATENVLAKFLNQPLNPKPTIIQESLLIDNANETGDATTNRSNVVNFASSTPKVNNENLDDFEDDFKIDEEIEMLIEVERELEQSESNRKKTPDMFDDTDLDFENIDIPNPPIPTTSNISFRNNSTGVISISDSAEEENSIELIKTSKQNIPNTPKPSLPVIWSIEKLLKTMSNISNGKFKIRGKFKEVKEKMCVLDDDFHLVVEVEDSTGSIPVKFHGSVVSELNGYTAEEFMQLKDEWGKGNSEAKSKALQALERLKNRLTELDNVLEVSIKSNENFPILLKIL